jgi:hypothetical protein
MKSTLTLFSMLFFCSFTIFAQDPSTDRWVDNVDDTEIAIPSAGKTFFNKGSVFMNWEDIALFKVNDASSDFLKIRNATTVDGRFVPWIIGNNQTDTRNSLFLSGVTSYTNDTGSEPIVVFDARKYADPDLLSSGGAIENRSLFDWRSFATTYMRMSANGSLGIGVTSPTQQLHTSAGVRFQGLPSATSSTNAVITADASGTLSRSSMPANTKVMFVSNVAVSDNTLMKINGGNVLVSTQMIDNGTNIGVGGVPTTEGKMTVYGNIHLLSDAREKENIVPIDNALEKLEGINGYYYDWKSSGEKQVGLIAQEVEKVLPEAVTENAKGTKFLNYEGVMPVLVEAVKEQQKLIKLQAEQIELLKKEVAKLKKK